ncbi:MAG: hypothetical protein H0X26_03175 [Alphaproteobacteria bacterium]|nr:hypothetical protein [Alphaproteobacteria bacterium]
MQVKHQNKLAQAAIHFKKSIDVVPDEKVEEFFPDTLEGMEAAIREEKNVLFKKIKETIYNSSFNSSSIGLLQGSTKLLEDNKKYFDWLEKHQELQRERMANKKD